MCDHILSSNLKFVVLLNCQEHFIIRLLAKDVRLCLDKIEAWFYVFTHFLFCTLYHFICTLYYFNFHIICFICLILFLIFLFAFYLFFNVCLCFVFCCIPCIHIVNKISVCIYTFFILHCAFWWEDGGVMCGKHWLANDLPVNNSYKCTIDRGVPVNNHCDLLNIIISSL